MAKKKQEDPPKGSPAWMATFSDLMNLLLCFFVLLFSMSSVDAAKFEMVVNSLQAAFSINTAGGATITNGSLIGAGISQMPDIAQYFGDTMSQGDGDDGQDQHAGGEDTMGDLMLEDDAEVGGENEGEGVTPEDDTGGAEPLEETGQAQPEETAQEVSAEEAAKKLEEEGLKESESMAESIARAAEQFGIQDLIEIDFNGQYVRITLNGALLFASGSAEMKQEATPLIDRLARIIDNYPDNTIEVEGHTDNVPLTNSKYEDNDVLSMYRALYVANRLRDVSEVSDAHIYSSGRGEYYPLADNSTAEGRARNRRVEIKIYNGFSSDNVD
ncbi:MAG: flagellar motor protein MotB [Lachnospiraceae bacterium]|nr:flagellar motor protein MotB [Lachnospiraceae bacterium]